MSMLGLRRRGRHLAAASVTLVAMAREDPLWLTVQAGRRLPSGVRTLVGTRVGRLPSPAAAAWGALLLDDPRAARTHVARADLGSRLTSVLAVHAGNAPTADALPAHRARWAWLTGDLTLARTLVAGDSVPPRIRRKVAGDVAALDPGPRPLPSGRRAWSANGPSRPVHVLTNSLPWTRSGYTWRTHAILTAQRAAGMDAIGQTRPAYPVSIGRVLSSDVDLIDGVPYHRSVPVRLPQGEAARVDRWACDLVALAGSHRATHLHSTTHYPNALAAEAAARALDLPWVHEMRGQLERTWASTRARAGDDNPYESERFHAWRARETEVATRADRVVTLSQTMRTDLVDRGVDGARITVVPNGLDPSLLARTTSAAQAQAERGLPEAALWVGSVSSVVHYEGFTTLVEAVAAARASGVDIRAAIVGDGVAWPELRAMVSAHNLDDVVLLPGRVARTEAMDWLDALDAVAVPRSDHEVTRLVPPLKVAEAMGCGRPVVVSDLPALTELVVHGENGLVVPPDDPDQLAATLVALAEDRALRAALGAQGRTTARGLTWDRLVDRYAAMYAEVGAR